MSEPRTDAGRRLLADLEAEPWAVTRTLDRIADIEAELDVERLADAMLEYAGERRVRIVFPVTAVHVVARELARRYAALSRSETT